MLLLQVASDTEALLVAGANELPLAQQHRERTGVRERGAGEGEKEF